MFKVVIYFLFSLLITGFLTYAGSDFYVALALGALLFAILFTNPISFQSKQEREDVIEKINKNKEKIVSLHSQRKEINKANKKRTKAKEERL